MNTIVIGAGLAGAAVAHALAECGCSVTVLDAQLAAASSSPSSGLPVALTAPHHSPDHKAPSVISQLSQLGLAATVRFARTLLAEGQDWQPCGALQRAGKLGPQARWFADAAWVKPAALVAAWLAHPRITLRTHARVAQLQRAATSPALWQAKDASGALLAEAQVVVMANAYGAQALLAGLQHADGSPLLPAFALDKAADGPLHQVAGQVVYGPWTPEWQALWPRLLPELPSLNPTATATPATQPCAINGNGHFIPAIPWQDGHIWLSGSTYEHDAPHTPQVTPQGVAANLLRLQQLIPAAANLLAAQHQAGLVQGWAGTRCTTRDRLPLVGEVSAAHAPGLYVCTAMGSRGLSFAAVCAQHLAANMVGQTGSLLPALLAQAVNAQRHI
jgi:tRNA 5-methylaminomethyl-2-thiouridine biosynthesis bifunctional protein